MSMTPFDRSFEDFITNGKKLVVDSFLAVSFEELTSDKAYELNVLNHPGDLGFPESSERVDNVHYRSCERGVLCFDPDGICIGLYVWSVLAIAEPWQKKGLGTELVIKRCLQDQQNPAAQLDDAAYSDVGYLTHKRAWEHMQGL